MSYFPPLRFVMLMYNLQRVKLTPFQCEFELSFRAYTDACNHCRNQDTTIPKTPSQCPPCTHTPPQPLATTDMFVLCYNMSVYWRKSHVWHQMARNLRQAYFTQNNTFQIHPDCPVYQKFSPFHG